jgi:hypothetical protein
VNLEDSDYERQSTVLVGWAVALTELASMALIVAIVPREPPAQPTGFRGLRPGMLRISLVTPAQDCHGEQERLLFAKGTHVSKKEKGMYQDDYSSE